MSTVWNATLASALPLFPSGLVLAAVLAAMVLHAAWNAAAKAMGDQVAAFFDIGAACIAAGIVFVLVAPLPATASVPFLAASCGIHVVYNTALLNSYRFGDLGQTYPIARGVAPLLVTLGAFVAAGEAPSTQQLVGLAVIFGGLASLATVRGLRVTDRRAVLLALLTGVAIASYTVSDGLGVRRSGSILGYAGLLFIAQEVPLLAAFAFVRRRSILADARRVWLPGAAAGFASVTAYALVLWAQTRTALATVSALRETSVVVGAIFGTVFLHEGHARRRIAAAAVVVVGVSLLVVRV
jgi:drug/metabolite transporter (DMT)-like permease